jgi:hypothetical protein
MAVEEGARPVASFWATGQRGSIAQAALVNGTAGHAFELDDIHKESIVHPNSLACPVALAFAEADASLTGRDILTAIVAGYEVGTRVGNAATMALFLRGFHPQGTNGAFVAAATAEAIRTIASAAVEKGGIEALQMQLAKDYIDKWGNLAKAGTSIVVPADLGNIGAMVATAMQIVKGSSIDAPATGSVPRVG